LTPSSGAAGQIRRKTAETKPATVDGSHEVPVLTTSAVRQETRWLAAVRDVETTGGARALALPLPLPSPALALPAPVAREAIKRLIDVIGATVGLILLAPLIALVSALITLDSPGPVLFAHQRLGRGGCRFNCLKFRSMRVDAERALLEDESLRERYIANSYKIPTDHDPRVTRIGRFLRKTSLDEVPQLLNVLLGDMSLVGPRPIIDEEAQHYEGTLEQLLSVRPGMSGAWAVRGRSRVGYPERAALELDYARNWTVLGDVEILLRTPWAVVSGRGVE
jgi:exopolysaccharide production protein ExoY